MTKNHFYEKKGPFPLNEIAKVIGCENKFSNQNNIEIYGFESLTLSTKNDITFLNSHKYKDFSLKTKAAACITTENLSKFLPEKCIKLNVKNVLFSVNQASKMFYPKAEIDLPDEKLKDFYSTRGINRIKCPWYRTCWFSSKYILNIIVNRSYTTEIFINSSYIK